MAQSRRYPKRPLVGVGAILLNRDRILMAQRGKEPLKGLWSLPGGALETGDGRGCPGTPDAVDRSGVEPDSVQRDLERGDIRVTGRKCGCRGGDERQRRGDCHRPGPHR